MGGKKPPDPIYRTIKVPLKSVLREPDKKHCLATFNSITKTVNRIVILAYQFNRLYLLSKYNDGQTVPFPDREFCDMVMGIVSRKQSTKPHSNQTLRKELIQFYDNVFAPLLPSNSEKPDANTLSPILQTIAVEMQTSYSNNIKVAFLNRLRRYLKINVVKNFVQPLNSSDKAQIRKLVNGINDAIFHKDPSKVPNGYLDLYNHCLDKFIPTEPYDHNLAYDLEANTERYLLPTLNLNNEFEKNGYRTFQPLSLRNESMPKYVPINIKSLINIMDYYGFNGYTSKNDLIKDATSKGLENVVWDRYFKLDSKVFRGGLGSKYRFYNRIDTDGVGCSITFILKTCHKRKPKPKSKPIDDAPINYITDLPNRELNRLKNLKAIGIDPGKKDMVKMIDADDNIISYGCKQRQTESLSNRNSKIMKRLRTDNKITELESPLNTFNSKTMQIDKFKEFLKVKNEIIDKTSDFYNQVGLRSMRLRGFIYKRKSLDKFLTKIEKTYGKDVVLGWGNWSRNSQMKGCEPSMGVGLRRIVSKKFTTYLVDEYRTSKICNKCDSELKNRYKDNKKIHRCLICEECQNQEGIEGIRFINRDVNGALNILRCLTSWIDNKTRPVSLGRSIDRKEVDHLLNDSSPQKCPRQIKLTLKLKI